MNTTIQKMLVNIEATIRTEAPLSIAMPDTGISSRYDNFPIMTRGIDADGNKQQTGYLPATTIRGFLRRAVVLDAMVKAAADGHHYTLQKAYADLLGQDAASEKADETVDLLALRKFREDNPVADLFGLGMTLKSRLLVSHFLPQVNILPEVFTGVRKDLDDTDGVMDALSEEDRTRFLSRTEANHQRVQAAKVVKQLEGKVKAAAKKGEATEDLEAALKAGRENEAKYQSEMGDMQVSSRTLVQHYALPAGLDLHGRLIIENALPRDIEMIELALDALSKRPLLGAQVARGCGEISGTFDVSINNELAKRISIGGFAPAKVTDLASATAA